MCRLTTHAAACAEPAAGMARQASSSTAAATASADTSYVLNPALRGDAPASTSFLLSAVRRIHAAATRNVRRQL